jgi:hypothetical protein
VSGDRSAVVVVVCVDRGAEVVLGRVVDRRVDLALVDFLARLQLAARRRGCSIRLRDPSPELHDLLVLAGVDASASGGWRV